MRVTTWQGLFLIFLTNIAVYCLVRSFSLVLLCTEESSLQVSRNGLNTKTPGDSEKVFNSEIRSILIKSRKTSNSRATGVPNKTIGQCPDCFFTIMILSAPGYRDRRDAVRSNYLSRSRDRFNYVFLVGKGPGIDEEQKELGDLLIYPYFDSYDNLTDKVMWGFREIFNGTTSSGILKTDDDSYVNTTQLVALGNDNITLFNGPFFGGFVRHPRPKEKNRSEVSELNKALNTYRLGLIL
eukprot:sb/3469145/